MTHHYSLQSVELSALIEQLCLSRECLDQLLKHLADLHLCLTTSAISPVQQESTLAQQESLPHVTPLTTPAASTAGLIVIAVDAHMQIAVELARTMAETDTPVLIEGATGTGKNLFAQLIHHQGRRSQQPLMTAACRQLQHDDVSTLIRQAGTGSLILEDIDDLPAATQTYLSTLLQQPTTCRVISQTVKNPEELAARGILSGTLLAQLDGCRITLPDLAQRDGDIDQLAAFFCRHLCEVAGVPEKQLSREYLELLRLYPWPGNVRELKNTLEQSLLCAGPQKNLYAKDLPAHIRIQTLRLAAARKKGL